MNRRSLFKVLIAGSGLLFSQSLFSKSIPNTNSESLNLHKSKFPFDLNPWPIDSHFTPGKLTGILIHHSIVVQSVLINQIERIRQIDAQGIINLPYNNILDSYSSNQTIRTCIKTGLNHQDLKRRNLKHSADILHLYKIENEIANDPNIINLRSSFFNEKNLEHDIKIHQANSTSIKYHMIPIHTLSIKAEFINERLLNYKRIANHYQSLIYTAIRPLSHADEQSNATITVGKINKKLKTELFDQFVSIWPKYPNLKPKPNSKMEIEITTYRGNDILTSTQALYNPQNYQITII